MLTELYLRIQNWLADEEGQGLVEYGLIIALVAILLVAALQALQGSLDTVFTNISGTLGGGPAAT